MQLATIPITANSLLEQPYAYSLMEEEGNEMEQVYLQNQQNSNQFISLQMFWSFTF